MSRHRKRSSCLLAVWGRKDFQRTMDDFNRHADQAIAVAAPTLADVVDMFPQDDL